MTPLPSLRFAIFGLAMLVAADAELTAQVTVKTIALPSADAADKGPGALGLIEALVQPPGTSCPFGSSAPCTIRGFYANAGTSDAAPGQFRYFDSLAPIPDPITTYNPWFGSRVTSFNANLAKKPGPQCVTVNQAIAFCTIGNKWQNGTNIGTERKVSVVDAMTGAFSPSTGDLPTDLISPSNTGRVPQGSVLFTTDVNGQRSRFLAVANYVEGSITFVDWTNVSSIQSVREEPSTSARRSASTTRTAT